MQRYAVRCAGCRGGSGLSRARSAAADRELGDDLLEAVRLEGLERVDQVKFAIFEVNGRITIIPKERG